MSLVIEHYRAMARYNRWMNERLYALAGKLTDEERRRDLGAFFGSLHKTLGHILLADRLWLGRFTGDPARFASKDALGRVLDVKSLDQALYADFARLTAERERTDDHIDVLVAGLTEEGLAGPLKYARGGVPQEHPLYFALSHFFNHQTHHRGQATTLLSQLGHDPGVTDLIALLRG